jgi:hypothetical protein
MTENIYYYLDTSAVVKRYVLEPGSMWVRKLIANHDLLLTSQITIAEVSSALAIMARTMRLTRRQREDALAEFLEDIKSGAYQTTSVSLPIIERAAFLVQQHPLKAYDAIHVATALHLRDMLTIRKSPFVFVCADAQALRAAAAEGLLTENPHDQE